MAKSDPILKRIEAFNQANGGGIAIQKAAKGYSLFREYNGEPVVWLCPTGQADNVEIMWWSHRDKWDEIGDFGPLVMPLAKALEFVAEDPESIFWR